MITRVSREQAERIRNKPKEDLSLPETVFLQGMEIKELRDEVAALREIIQSLLYIKGI